MATTVPAIERVSRNHVRSCRYDATTSEPISYTIAEALADAEGVPITELEVCLAEHVAVDALNTLFASSTSATPVSMLLTIDEYTIRIESPGRITVFEEG